jgi:tetratricopeptide (TPR) repeat protein
MLLLLAGCTYLPPLFEPDEKQLEQWIRDEYYGKAIPALENRFKRKPTKVLESRLNALRLRADQYDKEQARKVLEQHGKDNWKQALVFLNEGLQHYPQGKQLGKARHLLKDQQDTLVRRLHAQLLLARAQWLLSAFSLQEEIGRVDPAANIVHESEATRSEIESTANELYRMGMKALELDDLDLADSCFTMSQRLYPGSKVGRAIMRLTRLKQEEKRKRLEKEKAARLKQELARQEKERKKLVVLNQKIVDALNNDKLPLARKLLKELKSLQGDTRKVAELEKALNQAIKTRLASILNRGNQQYKNGQIEQARETWKKALELDPDNKEVKRHITRAETVLKRLKEIKKNSK